MNYSLEQIIGYIEFWQEQEDSAQKKVVLNFWLKQLKQHAGHSRKVVDETGCSNVVNKYAEAMLAIKVIAKCFGAPVKKKYELRKMQLKRICELVDIGWNFSEPAITR